MSGRVYDDVQIYLTNCARIDVLPRLMEIGKHVYKDLYSRDSRKQNGDLYGAIVKGRENALREWNEFVSSDNGNNLIREVENIEQQSELIKMEYMSDDFGKYDSYLWKGKFGEATQFLKSNVDKNAVLAIIFKKKMQEFSEHGNNFVIASYGKDSGWVRPTWWKWAIRETKLFVRTINTFEKQIKRMPKTPIMLPDGTSSTKLLESTAGIKNRLEYNLVDAQTWKCLKCGTINITKSFCDGCGQPKT